MKRKLHITKTAHSFKRHAGAVSFVAFSPDGKFALSGSRDKTLNLRDILNFGLRPSLNIPSS